MTEAQAVPALTHEQPTSVPPTFPMPRACPFAPPAAYSELAEKGPLTPVVDVEGTAGWLTTRHDVARDLLAHPKASKNLTRPGFPALFPGAAALTGEIKGFLIWMDPPEHTLYRHMLAGEFTLRRVQTMRPQIERIVDEGITRLLDGPRPVDLVHEFALPTASLLISELLGVPYSERDLFQHATGAILSHESTQEQRKNAFIQVRGLLSRVIAERTENLGDDLLSTLIRKYREADVFDHDHLVGMAVMLLGAGHETTANMIALGTLGLLEQPEALAEFKADPALAPRVVDELLRYFSIGDHVTCRVATEDIEVHGVHIPAGSGLIAPNAAANRDPAVFPNPDAFDIHRNSRSHLAFGFGIHQCLGQHLARLELEIVFTELFRRIPDLRVDGEVADLQFKDQALFYGLHRLPVTW
ncbi:hypothetical protein CcI49_13685 [Frankia sp. CcI49]|uniref:cytochrome P450 n=1 Tax=Frankia sp. CcI49 TaxID=1745382 RepID=UPI000977A2AB|nr:cytochrome P450 [Frankia sp. CcI49]ONH59795.1 hypothetical protein CcI49_13685 [Frankia sp. CcI49]